MPWTTVHVNPPRSSSARAPSRAVPAATAGADKPADEPHPSSAAASSRSCSSTCSTPAAGLGFGRRPFGRRDADLASEGSAGYQDTTGAAGLLPAGGVEWFKAAGGAWHGGGSGNSGRSRGFQLWLALPPSEELGPSESIYLSPEETPSAGPVSVLLGSFGGVDSPLRRRPRSTISRCI